MGIGAEKVVLMLLEERQDIVPAPALKAELAPVVVIGGLTAHVDHAVDGRGAPDGLAPGVGQGAPLRPGSGSVLKHQSARRFAQRVEIACGNVEPDPVVAPARLDHRDAGAGIGRKPVGQHAAGGTRADHHIVIDILRRHILCHPFLPHLVFGADCGCSHG